MLDDRRLLIRIKMYYLGINCSLQLEHVCILLWIYVVIREVDQQTIYVDSVQLKHICNHYSSEQFLENTFLKSNNLVH